MRFERQIQARPVLIGVFLLVAGMVAQPTAGFAQNAGTRTFLGLEISGARTSYVVTKDVNIRAKPETSSKRVGGLKQGQEIISPGRYQGWIAIEENGDPLGFAYFKYLQPFIDGALHKVLAGEITIGARKCEYEITFVGKTQPEDEAFQFADYNVAVVCREGNKELAFDLFAFMSEGPFARGEDSVHQIGVDLLAIAEDFDHVLSTIILFDHDKQKIDFDQITIDEYARKPAITQANAHDVATAIEQAVRMTLAAWNPKVWEDLSKALG